MNHLSFTLQNANLNAPSAPPQIIAHLCKALTDKLYEKRKVAAIEVEKTVRELLYGNNEEICDQTIREILRFFGKEFIGSSSSHVRNGGLISLAAVAIALGPQVKSYLDSIVPFILGCFFDTDSRVRYYALESLYNVSKVARISILKYFNQIFDALSKLAADSEISVKNGSELLDRLLKDVVAEAVGESVLAQQQKSKAAPGRVTPKNIAIDGVADPLSAKSDSAPDELELASAGDKSLFNLKKFIPLLTSRIQTLNPFTRLFLIKWISFLNSLPELELLGYLPDLLHALFVYLSDPSVDVRINASTQLAEFLREIREELGSSDKESPASAKAKSAVLLRMTRTLLSHVNSPDEETQAIALKWLSEFLSNGGTMFLDNCPQILHELLPFLGQSAIQVLCYEVNSKLLKLVAESGRSDSSGEQTYDLKALVLVLTNMLVRPVQETQLCTLEWLIMLCQCNSARQVLDLAPNLLDRLLQLLVVAESQSVLVKDVELLSIVAQQDKVELLRIVQLLVKLFSNHLSFADERGVLVVRRLCVWVGDKPIFIAFSNALLAESNGDFAGKMVQKLSVILLCAPETKSLRDSLKGRNAQASPLFGYLLRSFARHPASLLALMLYANEFQAASMLVYWMGLELELTVETLVDLDKLIQMIESPVFTGLRLQLLRPLESSRSPAASDSIYYLWQALYGILMLLPQSGAFQTLQNRLQSVASGLGILANPNKDQFSPKLVANGGAEFVEGCDIALQKAHVAKILAGVKPKHDAASIESTLGNLLWTLSEFLNYVRWVNLNRSIGSIIQTAKQEFNIKVEGFDYERK